MDQDLKILAKLAMKGYDPDMRNVNIGELKNGLSGYLQLVKDGEEVVVRDRSIPVARILPFRHHENWDVEAPLVASGAMKMPEETINWEEFFQEKVGSVTKERAIQVVLESRGNR